LEDTGALRRCSGGWSADRSVQAEEELTADQFMECLAISEEQREGDPDPEMKQHWAQYSDIYAANVYARSGEVKYIFDHIQEKMQKWANMRQFIAAASVNNLALAMLKKCDTRALEKVASMDDFRTAMAAYQKQKTDSPAP
jgi:hypothetical protein